MRDFLPFKHAADGLGGVYAGSTDQYRLTAFVVFANGINCSIIFFSLSTEYQILFIITDDRFICRNDDDIQIINFVKLTLFSSCCTGHTRKFMIHPEVILQGNSGRSEERRVGKECKSGRSADG